MKIAFVGKGGSGKSTLTSIFITHLLQQSTRSVLAIDADLNMNLAGLLGVKVSQSQLLSQPAVAEKIRHYLRGSNSRIKDAGKFLPTTPPGKGSHIISSAEDEGLLPYAVPISSQPPLNLLTVGSYDSEGIGQTCYHSHLFVAENILSHTITNSNFTVVCDMVAGTDAFAYSMHLQFDAIVLIAEPTLESTEVCQLYLNLGRESEIDSLIHVVANKVTDFDDLDYIRDRLGVKPLGAVPFLTALKKARQQNQPVDAGLLNADMSLLMEEIINKAQQPVLTSNVRAVRLNRLHLKLNEKKWVQLGYGDVSGQIDPDFNINACNTFAGESANAAIAKIRTEVSV